MRVSRYMFVFFAFLIFLLAAWTGRRPVGRAQPEPGGSGPEIVRIARKWWAVPSGEFDMGGKDSP